MHEILRWLNFKLVQNLDHVSKLRDSSLFLTKNSEIAQNSNRNSIRDIDCFEFWAISMFQTWKSEPIPRERTGIYKLLLFCMVWSAVMERATPAGWDCLFLTKLNPTKNGFIEISFWRHLVARNNFWYKWFSDFLWVIWSLIYIECSIVTYSKNRWRKGFILGKAVKFFLDQNIFPKLFNKPHNLNATWNHTFRQVKSYWCVFTKKKVRNSKFYCNRTVLVSLPGPFLDGFFKFYCHLFQERYLNNEWIPILCAWIHRWMFFVLTIGFSVSISGSNFEKKKAKNRCHFKKYPPWMNWIHVNWIHTIWIKNL